MERLLGCVAVSDNSVSQDLAAPRATVCNPKHPLQARLNKIALLALPPTAPNRSHGSEHDRHDSEAIQPPDCGICFRDPRASTISDEKSRSE